ncbi:MAG: ABC transporter ATP-binding protein [Bacillota bacterium]|nr:ABC transporter ATP-binding protein [Bacillota bacterium]
MILRIKDLQTHIGEFHILQGVSLEVPEGGVTVVLGRNGAGKTTTLRSIMGLIQTKKGIIEFAGESIMGLPPHLIARKGIGYVPEEQAIFSGLSVEENLRLAMVKSRDESLLQDVLDSFPDLKDTFHRKAGSLSGGQKQMLALGRALVAGSRLLLIDEPSKGLAPVIVEKVAEIINGIKNKTTVVLVEQNFRLAQAVGDRYFIIDDGRTVGSGMMEELVRDIELQQQYLGISMKKG